MKLLFICTHNRCRSILAEAITNHLSDGSLIAKSAGSQPAGEVHPLTLKYLSKANIETNDLKSQSWDEFKNFTPDAVITVCDSAANEQCPLWIGNGIKVHWGLPDPSKLSGSEEEIEESFLKVMATIEAYIKQLLNLNPNTINKADIQSTLQKIEVN